MTEFTLDMQKMGNNLVVDVDFWNKNTSRYNNGILTFDTGTSMRCRICP